MKSKRHLLQNLILMSFIPCICQPEKRSVVEALKLYIFFSIRFSAITGLTGLPPHGVLVSLLENLTKK